MPAQEMFTQASAKNFPQARSARGEEWEKANCPLVAHEYYDPDSGFAQAGQKLRRGKAVRARNRAAALSRLLHGVIIIKGLYAF